MDLWYAKILYYISITGTCVGFLFVIEATRIMIMNLRIKRIKVWHFALISLIVYLVAFILTTPVYKRIFTAELLLVVLWVIFQPAVIMACYYHGWIGKGVTIASMFLISVGTVLGLIFYNYYYSYTGFVQLNLGLYPYAILIFVDFCLILFLRLSKRTKRRDGPEVKKHQWDRDFRKKNRNTILIWLVLCTIATIPGWLYLMLHSYRGDMIASQYILGICYGFILLYLPFCLHYSIPEYDGYGQTIRVDGVTSRNILKTTESIARSLKRKGHRIETYPDQIFLSDLKMSQMHVIRIKDRGLIVLVQEMNRWPNPFKKDMKVLLSDSVDGNEKIKSWIKKIVQKELGHHSA